MNYLTESNLGPEFSIPGNDKSSRGPKAAQMPLQYDRFCKPYTLQTIEAIEA